MNQKYTKKMMFVGMSVAALGFLGATQTTASAETVAWTARTVEEVKSEIVTDKIGVQTYTVQWGDTLSVIAKAMNVSLDSLLHVNEIENAHLIFAGTQISYSPENNTVSVKGKDEEEHTYQLDEVATTQEEPQQEEVVEEVAAPAQSGYELTVNASGYSYQEDGLSYYTADGTNLMNDPQVIAVDPSVIPLGTLVEIPGYGVFRAADTGGAIKGNKIDIHFTTVAQALQFGRQNITVRVLN